MYNLFIFLLLKIIFISTVSFSQENNTKEKLVANYASFLILNYYKDNWTWEF